VTGSPFGVGRPAHRPRPRWDVLAAIFVGGCAGGLTRYALDKHWPTRAGDFPWTIFAINTAGAFVLSLVIVIAADVLPSRYLRPLLGTGFCGAFTTFSSVVVTADELIAHDHPGTAASYLAASIGAGLAAAWLGLVTGRTVATVRRSRGERS
jgi:CrcB protein